MSRVYTEYLHEVDLFKANVGKTSHTFILWIFMIENLVENQQQQITKRRYIIIYIYARMVWVLRMTLLLGKTTSLSLEDDQHKHISSCKQ